MPADQGLFARREEPMQELPLAAPTLQSAFSTPHDELAAVPEHTPDQAHQTAANFVFEQGRKDGNEHVAVVDSRTGEVIHAGSIRNRVAFDTKEVANRPADSLTVHHNHPGSNSLSVQDLKMLAVGRAISHVVAVGHAGWVYVALRGPALLRAGNPDHAITLLAGAHARAP